MVLPAPNPTHTPTSPSKHPRQERNAAIIRAEGESESAKLISDATKAAGAGLVELRRIEAAKDIAETMSKSQNVVYLPSGGNMLLGLNPR
jgi:prohibitin 1